MAPSPDSPRGEALLLILADLGTDHRCWKIAVSLKALGYRPVVLCDRPLTPLGPAWEGIEVRVLTSRSHFQGFLRAYLPYLLRLAPLFARTSARLWIVEDLPPLLWAALWGRLRGARVVYDAREIILETPMIRSRPARRLLWGLWHHLGLALCHSLLAVSPPAQAYLGARLRGKPVRLLPNVPRLAAQAAAAPATPREPPRPGEARLVYQGALRPGSGLRQVLRTLARAPGRRLDIYGRGPEEADLKALAAELGLGDRVRFQGVVPFERLPAALAEAHIGLHLLEPSCLSFDLTLSNKIFDYVHAGLPVLLGPTRAHRELIAGSPVGAVVADLSEAAVLAGLAELEGGWERYRAACAAARPVWSWEAFEGSLAAAAAP